MQEDNYTFMVFESEMSLAEDNIISMPRKSFAGAFFTQNGIRLFWCSARLVVNAVVSQTDGSTLTC